MILVCAGPPCSGKTTIAKLIASQLVDAGHAAEHISVDRLLTQMIPGSDRNLTHRTMALDEMHRRAHALAGSSIIAVLDATYTRVRARSQLGDACGSHPVLINEMTVSPESAASRFVARGNHEAIDQTPESVRAAAMHYPWSERPCVPVFDSEKESDVDIAARIVSRAAEKRCLTHLELHEWIKRGL